VASPRLKYVRQLSASGNCDEGTVDMLTIGIDPHKDTHCAVAVDAVGRQRATRTEPARSEGFAALVAWARRLGDGGERVWVIEDCRAVSGGLERFVLDHGETVVRLAPTT
jgi:transposase